MKGVQGTVVDDDISMGFFIMNWKFIFLWNSSNRKIQKVYLVIFFLFSAESCGYMKILLNWKKFGFNQFHELPESDFITGLTLFWSYVFETNSWTSSGSLYISRNKYCIEWSDVLNFVNKFIRIFNTFGYKYTITFYCMI